MASRAEPRDVAEPSRWSRWLRGTALALLPACMVLSVAFGTGCLVFRIHYGGMYGSDVRWLTVLSTAIDLGLWAAGLALLLGSMSSGLIWRLLRPAGRPLGIILLWETAALSVLPAAGAALALADVVLRTGRDGLVRAMGL